MWEQESDDESAPERYLDLAAFAWAGFVVRTADDESGDVTGSTPEFRHARLGIRAQMFWWLSMRLDFDYVPRLSSTPIIADARIDLNLHQAAKLRIGQFLVPFAYDNLYGVRVTAFNDRANFVPSGSERTALAQLAPRDIGWMLHGEVGDIGPGSRSPVLAYRVAMMNGNGQNEFRNVDDAFLFVVRAQLHLLGLADGAKEQGDLARNQHPRATLGFAMYSNCDAGPANWNRGIAADAEFRYQGVFAAASFVWLRSGAANGLGERLASSRCQGIPVPADYVSRGAQIQLGWTLPHALFPFESHRLELVARFDWIDPQSPLDGLTGGGPDTPGYRRPRAFDDVINGPSRYRLSFGVNWFPTRDRSVRVHLNYQHRVEAESWIGSTGEMSSIGNDVVWLGLVAGI